jgi:hypothetical protein
MQKENTAKVFAHTNTCSEVVKSNQERKNINDAALADDIYWSVAATCNKMIWKSQAA